MGTRIYKPGNTDGNVVKERWGERWGKKPPSFFIYTQKYIGVKGTYTPIYRVGSNLYGYIGCGVDTMDDPINGTSTVLFREVSGMSGK